MGDQGALIVVLLAAIAGAVLGGWVGAVIAVFVVVALTQ